MAVTKLDKYKTFRGRVISLISVVGSSSKYKVRLSESKKVVVGRSKHQMFVAGESCFYEDGIIRRAEAAVDTVVSSTPHLGIDYLTYSDYPTPAQGSVHVYTLKRDLITGRVIKGRRLPNGDIVGTFDYSFIPTTAPKIIGSATISRGILTIIAAIYGSSDHAKVYRRATGITSTLSNSFMIIAHGTLSSLISDGYFSGYASYVAVRPVLPLEAILTLKGIDRGSPLQIEIANPW